MSCRLNSSFCGSWPVQIFKRSDLNYCWITFTLVCCRWLNDLFCFTVGTKNEEKSSELILVRLHSGVSIFFTIPVLFGIRKKKMCVDTTDKKYYGVKSCFLGLWNRSCSTCPQFQKGKPGCTLSCTKKNKLKLKQTDTLDFLVIEITVRTTPFTSFAVYARQEHLGHPQYATLLLPHVSIAQSCPETYVLYVDIWTINCKFIAVWYIVVIWQTERAESPRRYAIISRSTAYPLSCLLPPLPSLLGQISIFENSVGSSPRLFCSIFLLQGHEQWMGILR